MPREPITSSSHSAGRRIIVSVYGGSAAKC